MWPFSWMFPAAAFFIVYVMLLYGGTKGDDLAGEGAWRELGGGKRFCYLASAFLPLLGFLLLFTHPSAVPPSLYVRHYWRFLLLPALSFLLGVGNLVLCFVRRPQRHPRCRHALLTLSLIPSLALATAAGLMWGAELILRNSPVTS